MHIRFEFVRSDDEAIDGWSYEDLLASHWPENRPVEFLIDRDTYTEHFVNGACWVEVVGDPDDLATFLSAYRAANEWDDDSTNPADFEVL
jgi:hypothetical protein